MSGIPVTSITHPETLDAKRYRLNPKLSQTPNPFPMKLQKVLNNRRNTLALRDLHGSKCQYGIHAYNRCMCIHTHLSIYLSIYIYIYVYICIHIHTRPRTYLQYIGTSLRAKYTLYRCMRTLNRNLREPF